MAYPMEIPENIVRENMISTLFFAKSEEIW